MYSMGIELNNDRNTSLLLLILRSWSRPRARPWTWLWARGWSFFPWLGTAVILLWGWGAWGWFGCAFFLPILYWGRRTTARLFFNTWLLRSATRIPLWLHLRAALWTGLALCWAWVGLARAWAWFGFAGSRAGPAVARAWFTLSRLPSSRPGAGMVAPLLAMGTGSEMKTKWFGWVFQIKKFITAIWQNIPSYRSF